MSSRTCSSVSPCCLSCFVYCVSLPPKYCFLISPSRLSTSLSVTLTPSLLRLLRELGALDEVLHGLVLQRLVLGRAGLREGALLAHVAALRLLEQRVELLPA